jgi:hypothetical protein
MGTLNSEELKIIKHYAKSSLFMIETGTGGSTAVLAEVASVSGAKFISIDAGSGWKKRYPRVAHVEYKKGWSIAPEDLIKRGHPEFVDCRKAKRRAHTFERKIAIGKRPMEGELDLIRRSVKENPDLHLDFFFCDTGEFFGFSEYLIVKNLLKPGGIWACHDIYYPRSIKCFKVVQDIESNPSTWTILSKTNKTPQGLLVAKLNGDS